jgi:hypothetical protein
MDNIFFIGFGEINSETKLLDLKNEINNIKPKIIIWDWVRESDITPNHINDELIQFLNETKIDIFILFGIEQQDSIAKKYEKYKNLKIIYVPFYFLNSIYVTQYETYIKIKKEIDKRVYNSLFICLNHHIKSHRNKTIEKICINKLFEYGNISWLIFDDKSDFKCWKQEIIKIDNTTLFGTDGSDEHWLSMNYGNPLINLVTETLSEPQECFFMTEKIAKPLLLGQLFLVVGTKNYHNNLKKYGFELYDEIFNYEFDEKESVDERIDGIMKNLLNIKDKNYYSIYEKVKEKIEKNIMTAIEIIKQNKFTSDKFSLLYNEYKDEFENAIENNKFKKFYFKKI